MTQLELVKKELEDGEWKTPWTISVRTGYHEGSIASRIRDLRLARYGGFRIEKRKCENNPREFEYRIAPREEEVRA